HADEPAHHHHDHDDEHEHHHHDHDEHGHHHHHHADEIFTSWGIETPTSYTKEEIEQRLQKLDKEEEYGIVLRAKGMVPAGDGTWVYFDYVPEECDIREGKPDVTGKICVIGSKLKEEKLAELFQK
ncbi:MAG: GTP-binding protein, partial [Lachnospiraceae bacterium]|nr:GTP-binding protein [Lachnospiraceae bacterium]